MPNHFRAVQLQIRRLDPAAAEILCTAHIDGSSPDAAVRGRLMGPVCRYASTIEVAYPWREWERAGDDRISLQAMIPDPCFWDPQSPFLYSGQLELWQSGHLMDQHRVQLGLRRLGWGSPGLLLNGQPVRIRGIEQDSFEETRWLRLRDQGFNTLLCNAREENTAVWEAADRFGFMVLGRLAGGESPTLIDRLRQHPSCLGWVLPAATTVPPYCNRRGELLGMELVAGHDSWPAEVQFTIRSPQSIAADSIPALPAILRLKPGEMPIDRPELEQRLRVLGTIEQGTGNR